MKEECKVLERSQLKLNYLFLCYTSISIFQQTRKNCCKIRTKRPGLEWKGIPSHDCTNCYISNSFQQKPKQVKRWNQEICLTKEQLWLETLIPINIQDSNQDW